MSVNLEKGSTQDSYVYFRSTRFFANIMGYRVVSNIQSATRYTVSLGAGRLEDHNYDEDYDELE